MPSGGAAVSGWKSLGGLGGRGGGGGEKRGVAGGFEGRRSHAEATGDRHVSRPARFPGDTITRLTSSLGVCLRLADLSAGPGPLCFPGVIGAQAAAAV